MTEKNSLGRSPIDIAIWKGQLKCVKQFFRSPWLETHVDIRELITTDSLKCAIDHDQLDILSFFINDTKRFAHIIQLVIDDCGQSFNLVNTLSKTIELFFHSLIPSLNMLYI